MQPRTSSRTLDALINNNNDSEVASDLRPTPTLLKFHQSTSSVPSHITCTHQAMPNAAGACRARSTPLTRPLERRAQHNSDHAESVSTWMPCVACGARISVVLDVRSG